MVNTTWGAFLVSALTSALNPHAVKKPQSMPTQTRVCVRVTRDAASSPASLPSPETAHTFAIQRSRKSVNTNTPLLFVFKLSIRLPCTNGQNSLHRHNTTSVASVNRGRPFVCRSASRAPIRYPMPSKARAPASPLSMYSLVVSRSKKSSAAVATDAARAGAPGADIGADGGTQRTGARAVAPRLISQRGNYFSQHVVVGFGFGGDSRLRDQRDARGARDLRCVPARRRWTRFPGALRVSRRGRRSDVRLPLCTMTSPGTPTWRSDPGLSPLRTRQPSVHLRRPEATAELAYVSVGCNRSVHGVDWNHESGAGGGFVAYGAHKAVAVYDPNGARVVRTLPGHDAPVTVVRWIPDSESPGRWLVSGDADGVVILWHRVDTPWGGNTPKAGGVRGVDPESHKWQVVAKQKAHGAPVLDARAEETVAGGKRTGVRLLVTASQDCCVKLWRLDLAPAPAPATGSISDANAAADAGPDADAPKPTGPAFLTQCGGLTFPLKRLPMSAALILVPHTDRVLLAVGGADGGVRLFLFGTDAIDARAARGAESGEKKVTLEPCGSLAGHADWVRDLAFAVDFGDLVARKGSDEQGNTDAERDMDTEKNPIGLLLASASQDRTARVWRLRVANVVETSAAAVDEEAPPAFAALAAPPAPPCTSLGGTARIASVLEALLQGHEDWVMSVAWRPRQVGARGDGRGNGKYFPLPHSAD